MNKYPQILNILNIIENVARVISIALFVYIFIAHLGHFLLQDKLHFDHNIFDMNYLRLLCIVSISTAVGGLILGHIQGKKYHVTFTTLENREKVVLTLAAIFFSIFFIGTTTTFASKLLIVILSAFLAYLFPMLIGFYSSMKFKESTTDKSIKGFTLKNSIMMLFALAIIGVSVYISFDIFSFYATGRAQKEEAIRQTLYIKSITPQITTHAETAYIEGYNFGWRTNESYKLESQYGEIPASEWTNEKITFTVPLHLKEGDNDIWVEKPESDNSKHIISSNKIKLNVVSRFVFYPLEQDNKFQRGLKKINRLLFFNVKIFNKFLF